MGSYTAMRMSEPQLHAITWINVQIYCWVKERRYKWGHCLWALFIWSSQTDKLAYGVESKRVVEGGSDRKG